MNLQLLVTAIAPVILILGLGFAAGKHHSFDNDQARGMSRLALHYALPASLFLGMAHFDRTLLLQQGPIVVVMLIGYLGFFLATYAILRVLHFDRLKAILLGYTVSSTAAPIYGLTVLVPSYGQQIGAGIVGLVALVTNLAQVSIVIFMLQAARSSKSKPSILSVGASTLSNPLIWCPVLGAVLALLGLNLSSMVTATLSPLAVSASGVAIFACGLALSSYPLNLTSRTVIIGSLICMVAHPALFFAMLKIWGLNSTMAQAAFVASAMPTSTPSVLFAQQNRACESEIASIMLVTTVGMILTLPASLILSTYL
ncbi:AEC family transporter [Sphingomonas sp.]|jgi:predicted permease|uniref:AEC family transporter n=1 Tax=Sphingomonas sp. TaxID=28214 RepID=UPI00263796A4|nr:AEC family transporter [Sphingomonas sp.]MDF2604150.1 transporter, auxin efflux carrier family [Sphingomonas sp.]